MCVVNKKFELLEFGFDSVDVLLFDLFVCVMSVVVWSSLICQ